MKYWIHVIAVLLLGGLLGQFLPWWGVAIIALISAVIQKLNFGLSAMFGFLGGFLLWAGLAFYSDVENQHILSSRMGELFGGLNTTTLIVLTGAVGGVIVALGSMVGGALSGLMRTTASDLNGEALPQE